MPKRRRENEEGVEAMEDVQAMEDVPDVTDSEDEDEDDDDDDDDDESKAANRYNILNEDDIEGQEEQTEEFDDEVQITPFNMKEEMEEGHFDKEGHYILNKKGNEVKDSWLDNIDWVKVSASSSQNDRLMKNYDDITDTPKFDPTAVYKEILEFLQPGETILKAFKRFGGGKTLTASQRWKKKKEGKETEGTKSDQLKIIKLTELADSVLTQLGNMDVYQETYESIRLKIQQAETVTAVSEPEQDMFGDVFVEKTKSNADDEPSAKKVRFNEDPKPSGNKTTEETSSQEVQWEFKWENSESAETHGPHSTSEMLNWVNEGYFEKGVWVRRVGQQGEFHNSRRVDFDLYL